MSATPVTLRRNTHRVDEREEIRVLLVEDDPDDHLIAVELLGESRQTRFAVDWVKGYRDACERVGSVEYDVALVDYQLGDSDGLALAREHFGGETGLPFIMLTGNADRALDLEAMRLGAADYLVKGRLDADLLERSIRYAIAHARSLGTIAKLNADLERRVRERTAALEYANKELEAFAFSVSHDLRAPLRVIEGFGRILQEDFAEQLGDQGLLHAQRIQKAGQAMNAMIDALMRLSKASWQPSRTDSVDLSGLVCDIVDGLRAVDPGREVEVTIEPGLTVEGDGQLLRAALENLIGNAWKFTMQESPARIGFGAELVNGERAFFVRDNGVGFDMAQADRLFGLFQRLHPANAYPGTGAGLAIVERVIHRHGGRVWGDGSPGEGATFHFTLGGWH
jgi:two-component system, sensor histidine kinase and response regulator